jgi:hypothetical protein
MFINMSITGRHDLPAESSLDPYTTGTFVHTLTQSSVKITIIIIPSTLRLPRCLFPPSLPNKISYPLYRSSCVLHAPPLSPSVSFDHLKNVRWTARITQHIRRFSWLSQPRWRCTSSGMWRWATGWRRFEASQWLRHEATTRLVPQKYFGSLSLHPPSGPLLLTPLRLSR